MTNANGSPSKHSNIKLYLVTIIRCREDCYKLSIMFNFIAFILYFMGSDDKIWLLIKKTKHENISNENFLQ